MATKPKLTTFAVSIVDKQLGAMIDNVIHRTGTLKQDIQIVAISCALHAAEHGDTGFAQRLFDGLGEGFRRTSLKMWFLAHGPFGYAEKKFTFNRERADAIKAKVEKNRDTVIAKMDKAKWWDAAGPEKLDGFDLAKELGRLLKKAERAQENPVTMANPKTHIDGGLLRKLKQLSHTEGASVH